MYAIKFIPIYYERIWGGRSIFNKLNKKPYGNNMDVKIGESWEIVDREDANSIVANGYLKGLSIKDLRLKYGSIIFGSNKNYNKPFNMLVKFLDAQEDLSLQVHPKITNGMEESKNEFWYILDCTSESKIFVGLKKPITERDFLNQLNNPNLKNILNSFKCQNDMIIDVKSGEIHAIGAGNLILEIQENSNTTYRVSDWGRIDSNGKTRELHINKALENIDLTSQGKSNPIYVNTLESKLLIDNDLFLSNHMSIKDIIKIKTNNTPSVVVCIEGVVDIINTNSDHQEVVSVNYGEVALLSANCNYDIVNNHISSSRILQTKLKI